MNRVKIKNNWTDRVIGYFSPQRGLRRIRARTLLDFYETRALRGGYVGASKSRRATSQWVVPSGDADADILPDLPTLRDRSRHLIRNGGFAAGAIHTKVTGVVGTGLRLQSTINREFLGISEDRAAFLQNEYEREWSIFASSVECDAARELDFAGIQELSFRSVLENGDIFNLLPRFERSGGPYSLKIQMIEADRVSNPDRKMDTKGLAGGIERDRFGAPVRCFVTDVHPGQQFRTATKWQPVDFFDADGRKQVIHLFRKLRTGQSRGVPDLAPVIELLKQLTEYSDAELMAATVAGMFTVFVKTEAGTGLAPMEPTGETGGSSSDDDFKISNGAILDLAPGESIETADPTRPNTAFDPFVQSVLRQIGVGLELPFELLIKHFTASYSAARAAILEAWKFYKGRRKWLSRCLCQPVYEAWFEEAVLLGRISAPGFLGGDIAVRSAYMGSVWEGDPPGQIQELVETNAAIARVEAGISSLHREVPLITGVDYDTIRKQREQEQRDGALGNGRDDDIGGPERGRRQEDQSPA